MTNTLKPYPAYKESGISWLTEIPATWTARRNGQLFVERTQVGFPELPVLEVSLKTGVRVRDFDDARRKQVLADRDKYKLARAGDIAYNMMRMWQGAVGVAPVDGLVSPAYVVARPLRGTVSDYFGYLFRIGAYMDQVNLFSRGIVSDRNRLYWDEFKQIHSPCPPLDEQIAIVRFLHHADRRIRRYIRAKQKLIKLLEEQKQAIIYRAVTRGLDPNARLKPSGIEFLGEVPESWEVVPFIRCAIERADYRGATPEKVDSGVFLVTAKNVRQGWIDYEGSKEYVRPAQYAQIMRRGLPRVRDILFTTEAPLGNVALVDREGVALAQRIIRFRLDERILSPQFALYSMLCAYFQQQLKIRATGSTAQGIKASKIPQLLILRPPVNEQADIVASIAHDTSGIDIWAREAMREIILMREYHTRLVADVVTGKVDVRAAALSEEREELNAANDSTAFEDAEAITADFDAMPDEVEV